MNGRVYSPSLGRMLSPDPVTQAPENGQNYNRYSYVFNNPLKYTDPSGFSAKDPEDETKCKGDACVPSGEPQTMGEVVVTGQAPSGSPNGNFNPSVPTTIAGDSLAHDGNPQSEADPVGNGDGSSIDCAKTPEKCTAAVILDPTSDTREYLQIAGFWSGNGSLAAGALALICPKCAILSQIALGLSAISVGSNVLAGDYEAAEDGATAIVVSDGLNVATSLHPVLSKIPAGIRTRIGAVLGVALGIESTVGEIVEEEK